MLLLIWHNTWMSKHGKELAGELRAAGEAVRSGEREAAALSIVIGAAILREGAELVLFLYGLVASGTSGADIQFGAVAGIGAGALLSAGTYLGLAAIPSRYVFSVTSVLIIFLAAGLAAQAAQFLSNAGVVEILGQTLWNSSGVIAETSWPGRVLHALVGYTDRPTALQGLVYVATIARHGRPDAVERRRQAPGHAHGLRSGDPGRPAARAPVRSGQTGSAAPVIDAAEPDVREALRPAWPISRGRPASPCRSSRRNRRAVPWPRHRRGAPDLEVLRLATQPLRDRPAGGGRRRQGARGIGGRSAGSSAPVPLPGTGRVMGLLVMDLHRFPALGRDPRDLDLRGAAFALEGHVQPGREGEGVRSLRAKIGQVCVAVRLDGEPMGEHVPDGARKGGGVVKRHDFLRGAPNRRRIRYIEIECAGFKGLPCRHGCPVDADVATGHQRPNGRGFTAQPIHRRARRDRT